MPLCGAKLHKGGCYVMIEISQRHLLIGYDYKGKQYLVMDTLLSQQ